jgi:hypothetical protein
MKTNMTRNTTTTLTLSAAAIVALFVTATGAHAAAILADEFDDIAVDGTQKAATIGAWDTVAGINAPSTTLTFQNGTDGTTALNLWDHVLQTNVPAGEVFPRNNMTSGGWDTTIQFTVLANTEIDLSNIVLDLRIGGSSGGDNTLNSKNGNEIIDLIGSVSGSLGSVTTPTNSYPTVEYTRTVDLSSLPTLDDSETYFLVIKERGYGFGHYKSFQAVALNGNITVIPEPSTMALVGLGSLLLIAGRRRG